MRVQNVGFASVLAALLLAASAGTARASESVEHVDVSGQSGGQGRHGSAALSVDVSHQPFFARNCGISVTY